MRGIRINRIPIQICMPLGEFILRTQETWPILLEMYVLALYGIGRIDNDTVY